MDKRKKPYLNLITLLEEGPKNKQELLRELSEFHGKKQYGESSFRHFMADANKELANINKEIKKESYNDKEELYFIREIKNSSDRSVNNERNNSISEYLQSNSRTIDRMILILIMSEYFRESKTTKVSFTTLSNLFVEYTGNNNPQMIKRILYADTCDTEGMIKDGYIKKTVKKKLNKNTNRMYKEEYYSLTNKAPYFVMMGINSWRECLDLIDDYGKDYFSSEALADISSKIRFICEDDMGNDEIYYYNEIGGREYKKQINDKLNLFNKVKYKKKAVKIKFYSKSKKAQREYVIKVGLMVYVSDKKCMYIMGENVENNKKLCIDIQSVIDVSEISSVDNDVYGSSEYIDIYNQMFDISVEKPIENVTVVFKNGLNIYEKLKRRVGNRQGATLEINDDDNTIIYKDKMIRGTQDFIKFLCRYGRAVIDISPDILRKKMKKCMEEVLIAYREEGLYE